MMFMSETISAVRQRRRLNGEFLSVANSQTKRSYFSIRLPGAYAPETIHHHGEGILTGIVIAYAELLVQW